MKPFKLMLCVFALIPLLTSKPSLADEQVTLQSSDGQEFKVDLRVAQKSETIKLQIEDTGGEHIVPLSNLNGKTLAKIVEFMKYASDHPFESDRALLVYMRGFLNERVISTAELLDVIKGFNYLDIRSGSKGDALSTVLRLYGDRFFGHLALENLGKITGAASYAADAQQYLSLPRDLQKIIIRQSFDSIDRIFLDTTIDRRLHAIEQTPLGVAQIIAYIAKNQTNSASDLPEWMREVLTKWQGADYASKIHFGPWPTEFATWPGHCPLPSDPQYNMYADATPNDRFTDNGDGTVTDVCTKLTWEQTPSASAGPWKQAKNHCTTLSKAEFTDWRAPTRIELQSIVNYAAKFPSINPVFKAEQDLYWSSTPAVGNEKEAWSIDFRPGSVSTIEITVPNQMRCVRGARSGPKAAGAKKHYTYQAASNTVTDNFTGAVWQRSVVDGTRDYVLAREYCQNLALEGSGWKLPTVKTLSTLIDVSVGSTKIDRNAFPSTPKYEFWSSSLLANSPSKILEGGRWVGFAWFANFYHGGVDETSTYHGYRARCVR